MLGGMGLMLILSCDERKQMNGLSWTRRLRIASGANSDLLIEGVRKGEIEYGCARMLPVPTLR